MTLKKIIALIFCAIMAGVLYFTFIQSTLDVKIDYGSSSVYTKKEMKEAIKVIKREFISWKGCKLHSLTYLSDDCNNEKNLSWMNSLRKADDKGEAITQCIMFEGTFRSPKNGGDGWEPDREYTWSWWLARSEDGRWKLMTWGSG